MIIRNSTPIPFRILSVLNCTSYFCNYYSLDYETRRLLLPYAWNAITSLAETVSGKITMKGAKPYVKVNDSLYEVNINIDVKRGILTAYIIVP